MQEPQKRFWMRIAQSNPSCLLLQWSASRWWPLSCETLARWNRCLYQNTATWEYIKIVNHVCVEDRTKGHGHEVNHSEIFGGPQFLASYSTCTVENGCHRHQLAALRLTLAASFVTSWTSMALHPGATGCTGSFSGLSDVRAPWGRVGK